MRVPHSAGSEAPRTTAPAGACDAHMHILDPRFPARAGTESATLDDYRLLQRRIGTSRTVVVQAKAQGTDHACLIDALERLGPSGRGIAVVHEDVSEPELRRLDAAGVKGIRFSLWKPDDAVTSFAMIAPLARRIAPLGWHVQLHLAPDQIVEHAALFASLPCPLVFDHIGRLAGVGPGHAAFGIIARFLEGEKAWLKLSGAYFETEGPPYGGATRVAQAFVAIAPKRLVWGSDWPHVTERTKPDDALLFDLLAEWAPDDPVRRRILVDNPARLYEFGD
jgi:D-galactarolactone isomerase